MSDIVSLSGFFKKFPDEETAVKFIEKRIWKDGVVCSHCSSKNITKCMGKKQPMPYHCKDCRKYFSVRIGTIFNESKLPLQKWLLAIYILTNCKKGVSSIYLAEQLGCTQKTAWFLAHRIRETWNLNSPKLFGVIEVDEVYIGGKESNKHESKKAKIGRGASGKTPVIGLKCREGNIKAFVLDSVSSPDIIKVIEENVENNSKIYTDSFTAYNSLNKYLHESVNHSKKEYVRGFVHTNGIESFWAVLKRGYYGIYHSWSIRHLHRYISEFSERFNMRKNDSLDKIILSINGSIDKRLSYKDLVNA